MTTAATKPGFDIDQFKIELGELLARYDVNLGVNLHEGIHALKTEFYVSENRRGGREFILSPYASYIDSRDLLHK